MTKKTVTVNIILASLLSLSFSGCGGSSDDSSSGGGTPVPETFSKSYINFIGTSARDYANASAYDSSNNLYVVGQTKGALTATANAGKFDMFLRKLDSNGNTVCSFQYGTAEDDIANSVALDSQGNVYVTGWSRAAFDGHAYSGEDSILSDGGDIFVMKFDSSCQKISSAVFGTADNDLAKAISVDSSDNIYVAGEVNGALNSQVKQGSGTSSDYYIMKLNTSLTEIWTTQYGSTGRDTLNDMVVDNNGSLYVGGFLESDIAGVVTVVGGDDGYVAKYNTGDGSLTWITSITDDDSASYDTVYSLALTSENNIIAGYSLQNSGVASLDKNGTINWQKDLGGLGAKYKVAVDSNDNIYVADAGQYSKQIFKLDSSGTEIFNVVLGTSGYFELYDINYNPNDGYVYAVGDSESDFDAPYSADNSHSGDYDGVVIKFK